MWGNSNVEWKCSCALRSCECSGSSEESRLRAPMLEAGEWFSPSKLGVVRARCVRCGLLGLRDSLIAISALLSTRISGAAPAHSQLSSSSTCSAAFAPLDRLLRAILAQLALLEPGTTTDKSSSPCVCSDLSQVSVQTAF